MTTLRHRRFLLICRVRVNLGKIPARSACRGAKSSQARLELTILLDYGPFCFTLDVT